MVQRTVSERLIDQGHPSVIGESVIASPESQRVAYWARAGRKWFVVVDGQKEKQYDFSINIRSLVFSPDSQRVACVALVFARRWGFIKVGESRMVVVDGQEGSQYDGIVTPPEGGGVILDSPDQLHYMTQRGNALYLVEERLA